MKKIANLCFGASLSTSKPYVEHYLMPLDLVLDHQPFPKLHLSSITFVI